MVWVGISGLALCWGFWRGGGSPLGTRELRAVGSVAAGMLLASPKEHSFSGLVAPVANAAVQTNTYGLTGSDGSYWEAVGLLSLDAALIPRDARLVLLYQPWSGSASVSLRTRLPSREAPVFGWGWSRGGRFVCELYR